MWEYKVAETDLHGGCIAELLESYNELELVSVIPNGTKVLLIFKRQLSIRDAAWADLEMDGDFVVHGPWGTTRFDSDEDKLDFTEFVQNLQKGE